MFVPPGRFASGCTSVLIWSSSCAEGITYKWHQASVKSTRVKKLYHLIRRNILIMFLISSHSETATAGHLEGNLSTWPRWFCVFYCQPVGRRAEGPRWLGALPTAVSRRSRPSSPGLSPPPGRGVWPRRGAGPLQPATPAQSPVGPRGEKQKAGQILSEIMF